MARKCRKKIIWFIAVIVIVIFASLLAYLFEPLFMRRSFIERVAARVDTVQIPHTAPIIEYQFGITSFGIQPFFAKLELPQEEYDILKPHFVANLENLRQHFPVNQQYLQVLYDMNQQSLHEFYQMKLNFNYTSVSIGDIKEIGFNYRQTGRMSIFLAGTSRKTQIIIIATNDDEHFLYVFHN